MIYKYLHILLFISIISGCSGSDFSAGSLGENSTKETAKEESPDDELTTGSDTETIELSIDEVMDVVIGKDDAAVRLEDEIIEIGGESYKVCAGLKYISPTSATAPAVYTPDHAAANAIDCDLATTWNEGESGPHYITIDLGREYELDMVVFSLNYTADQTDQAKVTNYQIFAGPTLDTLEQVKSFHLSGTKMGSRFVWKVKDDRKSIRYIKTLTTLSSSWVAWFEIEPYER